jgi:hypothetical protein
LRHKISFFIFIDKKITFCYTFIKFIWKKSYPLLKLLLPFS